MAVPGDCVNAAPAATQDGWRDLVRGGRAPVLALILLGDWMVAADALVTATIMPAVGESLAALAWFGWAAAGFLTGLVMAGASAGWLAERLGVRLAMILGGTVLTAGCLLSASATGIVLFLAGRVLQGCAAGWIIGLIYVALGVLFPQRHLPRTFALVTSVWGVATLAGPLIGGLFADAGAWRGVFWLFAAQAVLFTIAAACLIPAEATRTPDAALAPRPLLLLGAGVAALASAGLVETTAPALALAATGALLLMLALAEDRAGPHAVLPTPAVSPGFPVGAAYLTYFATSAAGVAFALYGPALLQFSAGLGALEAGYVVASEALAWTAAALFVAGAGEIWRARLIRIGTASIVAGTIGLTLVMASGSLIAVVVAGAMLGAGFGLCYAFISRNVIGAFGPSERARGSSAIGVARNAGGAVGAALAGLAANAAGFGQGLSSANVAAVAASTFGIGVPFALAGLLASMRMSPRGPAPQAQAGVAPGISASV